MRIKFKNFDITLFLIIIYLLIAGMIIEYILNLHFELFIVYPDLFYLPLFVFIACIIGILSGRRNLAEEELRESEERFRLMADNTNDIISMLTIDGTYIYVSPACHKLLWYMPEEMVWKNLYGLVHPDDVLSLRKPHSTVEVSRRTTRQHTAY